MDSGFGRNSIRRTRSRYNIKKAREKDKKRIDIEKRKDIMILSLAQVAT